VTRGPAGPRSRGGRDSGLPHGPRAPERCRARGRDPGRPDRRRHLHSLLDGAVFRGIGGSRSGHLRSVPRSGDRPDHCCHRAGIRYPCHDRSARVHHGRTRGCAGTVLRGGGVSRALKLGTRGSELALWQAEWGKAALAGLDSGVRIGTSSLRRTAQIRYLRADLDIMPLRGNVPTRVRKVQEGRDGLEAALFAKAGLERLGLAGRVGARLDPLEVMPAPGQGALGLEVRVDDRKVRATLAPLEDAASARAVTAERSLLAALEGGCQAPVAAYCGSGKGGAGSRLFGRVTAQDGSVQITASADVDSADPAATGQRVADLLRAHGAS